MDKILITGASGFVGRELCRELVSYYSASALIAQVRHEHPMLKQLGIAQVALDVGPETDWKPVLFGVSHVIHLAGLAHGKATHVDQFNHVNHLGTKRLARQSCRAGVKQFVFLSSVSVMGSTVNNAPLDMSQQPAPQTPYGQSKWYAELALINEASDTSMGFTVLRPPLVYGPEAPGNFLKLKKLIATGLPLPFAGLTQKRAVISQHHLNEMITLTLDHPAAHNATFLVADNPGISMASLITALARGRRKHPRLFYCPLPILQAAAIAVGNVGALKQITTPLTINVEPAFDALQWRPTLSTEQCLISAW